MDEFQREFQGIWIPAFIWLDKRLNSLDKIILMEINSLDNNETGCYASNEYLADFCNCSETKISTSISKLKKLNYIELMNFDGRRRVLKIKNQTLKNLKADFKNLKSININNNIDNKINIDKSILDNNVEQTSKNDLMLKENVKYIIDYLNESIKSNYKYTTKATINLIKARFKDGYKLDDFYDVIDKKVNEWKNTEFEQYLRPETLFGNKFENYLNQKNYFKKGITKTSYSSKPTFDNTANHKIPINNLTIEEYEKLDFKQKQEYLASLPIADMTKGQKEFFNKYCLAKDKDGNLIKF